MSRNTLRTFGEFWPAYLAEHRNPVNRKLHFTGTSLVLILGLSTLLTGNWFFLIITPVAGYSFAWLGHFIIEKNRPMTFRHPWWSLIGDFKMFWHFLTGSLSAELKKIDKISTDS